MPRVEAVEPAGAAEAASRVLREAWLPPCLDYSPEYLRWQLTFPGALPAEAVLARDGDEPAGFAGATPRRVLLGGRSLTVRILSFVAVRPPWRGQGLAGRLYDALLAELGRAGAPVVAFAEPGSGGEAALRSGCARAGWHCRAAGDLPLYAYLARPGAGAPDLARLRDVPFESSLLPALCAAADPDWLESAPDAAVLAHYGADPRSRAAWLLDEGEGGMVLGARTGTWTPQGPVEVVTLEPAWLPAPHPDALRALLHAAAHRWAGDGRPLRVTLPNPGRLEPAAAAAAGLRRIPGGFRAYLCAPDPDDPVLRARGTTVEVV